MPLLYVLGQYQVLQAVLSQLHSSERLFAFVDDIHVVSVPERGVKHFAAGVMESQQDLDQHREDSDLEPGGSGVVLRGHDALFRLAQVDDPEAQIWFGDLSVLLAERGIRVLGTPLGSGRLHSVSSSRHRGFAPVSPEPHSCRVRSPVSLVLVIVLRFVSCKLLLPSVSP